MLGCVHKRPVGLLLAAAALWCSLAYAQGQPAAKRRLSRSGRGVAQRNERDVILASANQLELPAPASDDAPEAPLPEGAPPDEAPEAQSSSEAPNEVTIPLAEPVPEGQVDVRVQNGRISLIARDAPLDMVLSSLAQQQGLNLVCAENITAHISITLNNVVLEDALNSILLVSGYSWVRRNNIIMVTSVDAAGALAAEAQGRELRVYRLDYASATELLTNIKALLSPVGRAFINVTDKADIRKTTEAICVEDLPSALERVEQYILEVDQPPRQVLIEARILKIDLSYNDVHGINWSEVFQPFGRELKLELTGMAFANAPQAMFATFNGADFDTLIQCLETTTDAKTLAAPKVLVVNGQEARFQVGGQLGFRVTTTTQTSTLQNVNFLNVGVVLTVTPRISRDNQILMHVKPEVSTGSVNQESGLPQSDTTNVETNTLLPNGRGMLIGGLIQEKDSNIQSKVPLLGDIWLVGKLFQRQTIDRQRSEVVIALVPRIVPFDPDYQCVHAGEVRAAQEPLLDGPLLTHPRPWEPRLPDPLSRPRSAWRWFKYSIKPGNGP